jgi:hypothetical protein
MDEPVNAAYSTKDVPEPEAPPFTTFLGIRVPTDQVWKIGVAIAMAVLVTLVIIFVLMPSGLSFLAAKNATGLLSYMGLFAAYMFGFIIIALAFFGVLLGVLYAIAVA